MVEVDPKLSINRSGAGLAPNFPPGSYPDALPHTENAVVVNAVVLEANQFVASVDAPTAYARDARGVANRGISLDFFAVAVLMLEPKDADVEVVAAVAKQPGHTANIGRPSFLRVSPALRVPAVPVK